MLPINNDKDAIAIAPHIHTVIFEKFRVLDVRVKPCDKAEMHWHPENVSYILEGGFLRFTQSDGSIKEVNLTVGQVTAPGEGAHVVENIGTTEVHVVQVELKV